MGFRQFLLSGLEGPFRIVERGEIGIGEKMVADI